MAGFQTASLMAPDHPVLYGTTLAISLVGSVAALSSGGISVPVARVEYALGLTEDAPAAVTNSPVVTERVDSDQAEVPAIETPEIMAAIPVARHVNSVPFGLEAVQLSAAPKLAKTDFAARPQLELQAAPPAVAEPVNAELQGQQLKPPVAAPAGADVTPQLEQSFVGAFQAIPTPSLAALPQQHDGVPGDDSAISRPPALTTSAAEPGHALTDQHEAALTPVPVAAQSKPIIFPAAVPVTTHVLAYATKTLVATAQVASKLAATSGTLAARTSLQKAEAKPALAAPTVRLINSPDLRRFDLARIHTPARTPTASLGRPAAKSAQSGKVRTTGAKDKLVGGVVFHQVTVSVAGSSAQPLDVRIGADMKPSIKVGDLLGLVSDRMDPASVARFASAASAEEYVSLAALRAAGFNVSYNAATDSISIYAAD